MCGWVGGCDCVGVDVIVWVGVGDCVSEEGSVWV